MFYPRSPFNKYPEIAQHIRTNYDHKSITDLLDWLCQTPKITTLRTNILKTTPKLLIDIIKKNTLNKNIEISSLSNQFPNIIVINNKQSELDDDKQSIKPIDGNGEVIVDASCGSAVLRGAHIFAPGVLAMPANTNINETINIFVDLMGKCKKGTKTIYESDRKTFIGHGIVRMQRYQLFGDNLDPSGIAIEVMKTISNVPSIGDTYFPSGYSLLQNLPSIICGHVLNPIAGDLVLDMCASPGNKTTHLAELMNDSGDLIAIDKTPNKVKILQEKCITFNLNSVKCFSFDSTKLLCDNLMVDMSNNKNHKFAPPYPSETFDKILLDGPCSALGIRPQLNNNISVKMLSSYPIIQKKLFFNAVHLLRSGGTLVYSTCTIVEAENEGIVKWALDKFSDKIELVSAEPFIGGPGWRTDGADGLNDEQRFMVQRFGPEQDSKRSLSTELYQDTVGFFIAKFIKKK